MRSCFLLTLLLVSVVSCQSPKEKLPILSYTLNEQGEKEYYSIEYSGFINQLNESFTGTKDKVYIANFFFTRCPSICPPMRRQLIETAEAIGSKNFMIISHTIDPDHDTPTVLKDYSDATGIPYKKWQFLTASEAITKAQAKLFMTNFKPNEEGTDFYHSSYAALVDEDNMVRGFYNLLIPKEVELMKADIKILLN